MIDKKPVYISDLHFEHRLWLSELAFWQDEIGTFKHRLEEVVTRITDKDVLAKPLNEFWKIPDQLIRVVGGGAIIAVLRFDLYGQIQNPRRWRIGRSCVKPCCRGIGRAPRTRRESIGTRSCTLSERPWCRGGRCNVVPPSA